MPQQLVVTCLAAALSHVVSTEAGAQPASAAPATPQAATTTASHQRPSEETYRLPLALAYGVPLSFQIATRFIRPLQSDNYLGLAFAGMLAAPFVVHAVHDNTQGGLFAELGILGSLLGGAIVGATALVVSGKDVCKDCDDGVGEVGTQIIIGGALGAATGYLAWGVIDTAQYARVPQPPASSAGGTRSAGIRWPAIAVVPHSGADRSRALAGFSLVLAGEF